MPALDPQHRAAGVDVIVRFHDATRLMELDRAVFSLVGQHVRPLRIILVTQRFTAAETAATLAALEPILAWSGGVEVAHVNLTRPWPEDARSDLINLGFAAVTGRYVALLDYDDVIFPEAYHKLIGRLRASEAGIAFARTPVVRADMHASFLHARSRSNPYLGFCLENLFEGNFVHSFLIDRTQVPEGNLRFEPMLAVEEDYEFLIRLCAAVTADFDLVTTDVGLYLVKTDASNTGNTYGLWMELAPEVRQRAEDARAFVEARRRVTVLAPAVQRALGLAVPVPGLTVRRWLDQRGRPARRSE